MAANDKEFPLVLDTLMEIHTLFILQQCRNYPDTKVPEKDDVPHIKQIQNVIKYGKSSRDEQHAYLRRAIKAMRISESDDPVYEGFIQQLFGYESKYDKDIFLAKIQEPPCDWIFDGKKTRLRMDKFLEEGALDKLDLDE